MPVWAISLLISVAMEVVAFLIMPKPRQTRQAVQDLTAPTAEAGRPIPVVFGSVTVKGTNVLWYGDVSTKTYTTSSGGGGK